VNPFFLLLVIKKPDNGNGSGNKPSILCRPSSKSKNPCGFFSHLVPSESERFMKNLDDEKGGEADLRNSASRRMLMRSSPISFLRNRRGFRKTSTMRREAKPTFRTLRVEER
jgi:hypothetical protein